MMDAIRAALDESVGTRGSLRNCHHEKRRRQEAEAAIEQLRSRIPPATAPDIDDWHTG